MLVAVAIGGGSLGLFAYFLQFGPPLTIDLSRSQTGRLTWDTLLCLVFFIQHSGMIRRGAKDRITEYVGGPFCPAFYAVTSGITLAAVILLWQPTGYFFFRLEGPARWFAACVSLLALAGFAWGVRSLRDFDPFGTRPIKVHLRGATLRASRFVARGAYRHVRHPLYLFMLMLLWSVPRLSADRLLFNVLWTAWVVVGSKLEERDLRAEFGEVYRQYQLSVPMLVPWPRSRKPHH
jgi:protein-S-isoprenylcysteine O-methyltransferase Ste14